MTSLDRDYYLARAIEHRALAQKAETPKVSQLHLQLATKYEDLASQPGSPVIADAPGDTEDGSSSFKSLPPSH
jgi:hypothetical protein